MSSWKDTVHFVGGILLAVSLGAYAQKQFGGTWFVWVAIAGVVCLVASIVKWQTLFKR